MRFPLVTLSLLVAASPAFATVTKTWVSSTGSDAGTCQLNAPCKTLQFAHDQTSPGGEIDVKDTGSYGALTISKAVSVVSGDGLLAAVGAPSGGVGIVINAGPNDAVLLEGLFIDGHGVGQDGIDVNKVKNITIENCHIRNVTAAGINIQANQSSPIFAITNTEVATAGSYGIALQGASSVEHGSISGTFIHDNGTGIFADGVFIKISRSTIINNNIGFYEYTGNRSYLEKSTISGNTTYGIQTPPGGAVFTYGNNYIIGNGTNVGPGSLMTTSAQ